jgi:hypothetical protein
MIALNCSEIANADCRAIIARQIIEEITSDKSICEWLNEFRLQFPAEFLDVVTRVKLVLDEDSDQGKAFHSTVMEPAQGPWCSNTCVDGRVCIVACRWSSLADICYEARPYFRKLRSSSTLF